MMAGQAIARLWFGEFSERVSIEGLTEIHIAPTRVVRCIWILVVVGGVFLTGYYSYRVVTEYNDNNTATKVLLFVHFFHRSGRVEQLLFFLRFSSGRRTVIDILQCHSVPATG
jgi:hypothetical protein